MESFRATEIALENVRATNENARKNETIELILVAAALLYMNL